MLALAVKPAETTAPSAEKATLSLRGMVEHHNKLAAALGLRPVNKFTNRAVALKRVERLEAEYAASAAKGELRKKRQKVFNYPPLSEVKVLKPGTLRAEARDLLLKGATMARVEELVADWDVRQGHEPYRLEPRAYGLVRLLHTWAGYALREEGVGNAKVIYVMDVMAWSYRKSLTK